MKLVDQSARDLPELAAIWFGTTRAGLVGMLTAFLETHIADGALGDVPDVGAAARAIVEVAVFWAVHRHWDAHPQAVDEAVAKATVLHFAQRAFALGSATFLGS